MWSTFSQVLVANFKTAMPQVGHVVDVAPAQGINEIGKCGVMADEHDAVVGVIFLFGNNRNHIWHFSAIQAIVDQKISEIG